MATTSLDGLSGAGDAVPQNGETIQRVNKERMSSAEKDGCPKAGNTEEDVDAVKEGAAAAKMKIERKEEKTEENESASMDEPEDETDDEDDGEETVPLLERSPQLSGKRERKTVERFVTTPQKESKRSVKQVEEGSGVRLGDCPVIEHNISSGKPEDVKTLHQVIFLRPGRPHEFRRNLRNFRGFAFKKGSPEYDKKKENLERYRLDALKEMARILDLSKKTGAREELALSVLEFLCDPKPSGREVKKRKPKSKSGSAQKATPGKKRGRPKMSGNEADIEDAIDSVLQGGSESDDDSEDEEPPKKKKASPQKSPAKKTPKKTPAKPAKKTARKKKGDDESSSEDEPLVKKPSKPPTDAEIRSLVRKLLDGANLEEVTMKTVLTRVYAKYPQHDLTPRKDFIKQTVKALIS